MSSKIVFAMYRPNAGKDGELRALIARHLPALRNLGLVTSREPMLVRAKDGSYIDIFEWLSDDAALKAHEHPEIAEIWEQMGVAGGFGKLCHLSEANLEFPHFEPISP